MANEKKQAPKAAGGKGPVFISAATWEMIRQRLGEPDLTPDPTQFNIVERAGKKFFHLLQDPSESSTAGGGIGSGGAFCELYQDGGDWFIKGGLIRVSDTKSFEVEPYAVSVAVDDEWLLYMQVDVQVNRDDDGDYFLPGLVTSSNTSIDIEETTTITSYPAGTAPVIATGLGTITLEVGRLVVASGIPTFSPTGCGSFVLTHCAGSVSYQQRA